MVGHFLCFILILNEIMFNVEQTFHFCYLLVDMQSISPPLISLFISLLYNFLFACLLYMFEIKICNFTKYAEREVKSHNKLSYTDVCEEKLCIEVEQRNEQITFAT